MFNRFEGIGRLAAEPDSRFAQSGKQVVNFTVCCDSGWGDSKKTEFVRCVAWEKLAGIISEYNHKGSLVFISGEMQTRQWEDKDGGKKYTTEIMVRDFKMLSGKGDASQRQEEAPAPDMGDDVPF